MKSLALFYHCNDGVFTMTQHKKLLLLIKYSSRNTNYTESQCFLRKCVSDTQRKYL